MLAPSGAYYVSLSAHGIGADSVELGIPRPTLGATTSLSSGVTARSLSDDITLHGVGNAISVQDASLLICQPCSGLNDRLSSGSTLQSSPGSPRRGSSLQRLFATGVRNGGPYPGGSY